MTGSITLHSLTKSDPELKQAMRFYVQNFKHEDITSHIIDFDQPDAAKLYSYAMYINAKLYIDIGEDIIIAKLGDEIVGILVTSKGGSIPLSVVFSNILPAGLKTLPLLKYIKFKNLFEALGAMKIQQPLPTNYVSVNSLAISADYRGQGIARQLLEAVPKWYGNHFDGAYLYTGSPDNRDLYEHMGYALWEAVTVNDFTIYHMYRAFD